jgi:hypothetical protein
MINDVNYYYVLVGIVALVASRFLSVAMVALCVNPFRQEKIPFSHQLVMTIGGLRGAVAFYLALNVSSEYKHLIITTTISLILFTVIGMGSFTPIFLKWLNKTCPQDEIIVNKNEEMVSLAQNMDNYEGDDYGMAAANARNSIGVFSKAEDLDKNYLQRFFRKDGWKDRENDQLKQQMQDQGIEFIQQDIEREVEDKYGDFSPHRKSNLVNQELKNRITDSKQKRDTKRALTPPGRKQDDEEKDLRGILKGNKEGAQHEEAKALGQRKSVEDKPYDPVSESKVPGGYNMQVYQKGVPEKQPSFGVEKESPRDQDVRSI